VSEEGVGLWSLRTMGNVLDRLVLLYAEHDATCPFVCETFDVRLDLPGCTIWRNSTL
jgi:hypothetical protein